MLKIKKYYCTFCKRYHYRGKIYQNHLKYQQTLKEREVNSKNNKNLIPTDKIIDFEKIHLRSIAKRQIRRCVRKMYLTKNFSLYIREINKIILLEKKIKV